jgi:type IV fimbrial biogenesis protein FimT
VDCEEQLLGDQEGRHVLIMTRSQLGTTLIELMAGLVIIGFLLMLAVPMYTQWNFNSQIRNTAESIKNGLQLARTEAAKQNRQVDFVLNTTDFSWKVKLPGAGGTIIQERPPAEGNKDAKVTASGATVSFNGLGQSLNAGTATFRVENPTGGSCGAGERQMRCTQVEVRGGQIRMCLPSDVVPASDDPRKC